MTENLDLMNLRFFCPRLTESEFDLLRRHADQETLIALFRGLFEDEANRRQNENLKAMARALESLDVDIEEFGRRVGWKSNNRAERRARKFGSNDVARLARESRRAR